MLSQEAPVTLAKACEIFILDLTLKAWEQANANGNRSALQVLTLIFS